MNNNPLNQIRFADEGPRRRGPSRFMFAAVLVLICATFARAAQEVSSFTVGSGDITAVTNGQLLIGKTSDHTFTLAAILGTTDEIIVTNGGGSITLTTPQGINTTSSPTFANLTDSGLTAKSFVYSDASKVLASTSAPTNGQLLIGSTGAVPVAASLTAGTGITVTPGAGSITIASTAGPPTVTAKTSNYSVLAGDTNTFFTNTGASAEVDFTLPTSTAGQVFAFYIDAVQIVKIIAPSSTTIQIGGSVSTTAGNISATNTGYVVWVIGLGSNKYVCWGALGAWTTA